MLTCKSRIHSGEENILETRSLRVTTYEMTTSGALIDTLLSVNPDFRTLPRLSVDCPSKKIIERLITAFIVAV